MLNPPELTHDVCVAVVDDDEGQRAALVDFFDASGLKCVAFESSEAFLASASTLIVDCMVLDLQLPDMNGIELQSHLNEYGSAPPIIFLTSFDDPELRRRALAGGARYYLVKPVDTVHLIDAVMKCLNTRRDRTA